MYESLVHKHGKTDLTLINGKNSDMLMDISIYELDDETIELYDDNKETAILLLSGKIELTYNNKTEIGSRKNVFDELPFCLHIPCKTKVIVKAYSDTSILVQKTENEHNFNPVLYRQEDFDEVRAGDGFMENTANRLIRTIFDINNAPYSNMVLGEVISLQGRWSSYPPHHHDQPEVYYYLFDKKQGFGCAMVGEEAYLVKDHSYITIPGGLAHPQSTAPGYAMYFCWMIRHLDNNPWTTRVFEEEHKWMVEE